MTAGEHLQGQQGAHDPNIRRGGRSATARTHSDKHSPETTPWRHHCTAAIKYLPPTEVALTLGETKACLLACPCTLRYDRTFVQKAGG